MRARILIATLFITACTTLATAQDYKDKKALWRFYAGPVISFYKNNEDFTANTHSRIAVVTGLRYERMLNGYNSLCIAAEFFTHGLSFDSYYFLPGQLTIYDKTFPYAHSARLNELHVPLLFKYNSQRENDKGRNAYSLIGISYRHILSSYGYITSTNNNNRAAWEGDLNATMEYKIFSSRASAMLMGGFGAERNYQNDRKAVSGEIVFKYGLSRFKYNGSGTAAPFFIKDAFLSFNLGYKF